jgi:hypothetical protein
MHEEKSLIGYETPAIRELGSLRELTAACQGFGAEDANAKTSDPFINQNPDFSDPGFCQPD